MKFLIFFFALAYLYALVQAKGEITQQKESPLRKILRSTTTTTSAPVESLVEENPAPVVSVEEVRPAPAVVRKGPRKVTQSRQTLVQEPLVQSQKTVQRQFVQRPQTLQQPLVQSQKTVQRQFVQRPQTLQQPLVQSQKTVQRQFVQRQQTLQQPLVESQKTVQRQFVQRPQTLQQPLFQSQKTVQRPRKFTVMRDTQAPFVPVEVVPTVEDTSSVNEGPSEDLSNVEDANVVNERPVEVVRTAVGPEVVRTAVVPEVVRTTAVSPADVVAPEVVPTAVEDTSSVNEGPSEDLSNVEDANVVNERPVEVVRTAVGPEVVRTVRLRPEVVIQEQFEQGQDDTDEDLTANVQNDLQVVKVVQVPRKLEAPRETRRRFNVLLRTAEGFNEKAGYTIHSRNAFRY